MILSRQKKIKTDVMWFVSIDLRNHLFEEIQFQWRFVLFYLQVHNMIDQNLHRSRLIEQEIVDLAVIF